MPTGFFFLLWEAKGEGRQTVITLLMLFIPDEQTTGKNKNDNPEDDGSYCRVIYESSKCH